MAQQTITQTYFEYLISHLVAALTAAATASVVFMFVIIPSEIKIANRQANFIDSKSKTDSVLLKNFILDTVITIRKK